MALYVPNFEAVGRLRTALAPGATCPSTGSRPLANLAGTWWRRRCKPTPRASCFRHTRRRRGTACSAPEEGSPRCRSASAICCRRSRRSTPDFPATPGASWRVPELNGLSVVSFSDADSPVRPGREVMAFDGEPSCDGFRHALATGGISCIVEFFPEGGGYRFDGHWRFHVCQSPEQTLRQGDRCPSCGRRLTLAGGSTDWRHWRADERRCYRSRDCWRTRRGYVHCSSA